MSCFNIPSHVLDVLFLRYAIAVVTKLVILYVLFNIPDNVLDVLFLRYPIGVLTELVILYVLFNIPGRVLVKVSSKL